MDELEELMSKRKWIKHSLRTNVAQPDDIHQSGKVKVAKIYSNLVRTREKDPMLYDAIKEIAPEWWGEETQIILNKDLTCKRHRDGNKEHSWILWLGDFTGGALHFEDGTKIEEKYKWHKINGQTPHWNDPHEGTKYAIVLYRSTRAPKCNNLHEARRRKREREERERQEEIPVLDVDF